MTTILDNIKHQDVLEPVTRGNFDVNKDSTENTKFADVIEQANISSETNVENKKSLKSTPNEGDAAVIEAQDESDDVLSEGLEQTLDVASISTILPETQSKVALNEVKGYQPIQSDLDKTVNSENLQAQIAISTSNGNKLPDEGQIQPVIPSQPLTNVATTEVLGEEVKLINPQLQSEFESKVEITKIVNLNPVEAKQDLLQTKVLPTAVEAAVQAEVQKEPKQTIQPINLGNTRIQSQVSLIKDATTSVQPTSQGLPNPSILLTEGNIKTENQVVNKLQGELQHFVDAEVKIKNNPFSQLVKTDGVVENTTTSNIQNTQHQAINTLTTTPAQTSIASNEAKLTTITMQTAYTPGNKEWSENFSRNIALMSISKNNLAEIRMDPPHLGAIQVKISHTGTETNLQFHVNHNDTRQAIETSIQRLKEAMAEQGFSNINVDISQGEQSRENHPQENQTQANTNLDHEETLLQQQTSILQLGQLPSSGIDFFA